MDDFQSYYPDATTTTNADVPDENAIVLASLLQELSFWEPSTPNSLPLDNTDNFVSGILRKSRSANDATTAGGFHSNNNTRSTQQRLLPSTSYNGSTTNDSSEAIIENIHSLCNNLTYQQRENLPSYDNAILASSSDYPGTAEDNHLTSSTYYNHDDSRYDTKLGIATEQLQQPGSPTLVELQERCHWNKAIDPASGRAYYYDVRTRQTQWEKPKEIRAIEKKIKKDQRLLDEKFFREMECNLLASLARGEFIPIQTRSTQQHDNSKSSTENGSNGRMTSHESSSTCDGDMLPQPNNYKLIEETNSAGRIRTISCMNEHLLAQIQQPIQLQRVSSINISKSLEGRPPLPSRPITNTGSTNPFSTAHSLSNQLTHDGNQTLPSSSQQYLKDENVENNLQSYIIAANDDYDDLRLSPDNIQRKQQISVQDDILRGEELLDGALMLADLEVSDDEDTNDDDRDGGLAASNIVTGVSVPQNPVHVVVEIESTNEPNISVQPFVTAPPAKGKKSDSNGQQVNHFSHIRRNTAGEGTVLTTHMNGGTMEKPDIDSTIHVVCGVIRAHIEQSCQQTRPPPPPLHASNVNLEVFRDDYDSCPNGSSLQHHHRPHQQPVHQKRSSNNGSLPSLEEIKAFYREFYQRSQMEFDAIIMSLIYVERLIKLTNGAVIPSPYNWASVIFSCMVLASKVWDDLSMWNIDFSNVSVNSGVLSPFSLKRINELELAVLACLNFAVAIPGSEYAKYYYLLRSMMIRGGLLDPFAAKQQLSKDTTIRLQDRTKLYEDSIAHHADEENPRRRVRSVDWTA